MKNNSLRLRLSQGEVARFSETGRIAETIEFGLESSRQLIYELEANNQIKEIQATVENNRITVSVPLRQAEEWTTTETVGLKAAPKIGGEKTLQILIEKDFACLEPRPGEDARDAYPHPEAGKGC